MNEQREDGPNEWCSEKERKTTLLERALIGVAICVF